MGFVNDRRDADIAYNLSGQRSIQAASADWNGFEESAMQELTAHAKWKLSQLCAALTYRIKKQVAAAGTNEEPVGSADVEAKFFDAARRAIDQLEELSQGGA